MPLFASVVVIILIAAAFGYYYVTASSNISSLNGQVTSLNGQVSTLNLNVTGQDSARHVLRAHLEQANATIASLTSEAGSLSSEISSQSSQVNSLSNQVSSEMSQITSLSGVAYLNVETTLLNNQNYNMPFNSSTTIMSFSVSTGGYLQISGTSNTYIILAVCYGSTSQSQCDTSLTYYDVDFGYGSAIFNVPLLPGQVWINAYNYDSGTATLTVNEWT